MQQINIQYYSSTCGEIILASTDDELCLCEMYKRVLTNGTKKNKQKTQVAEEQVSCLPQ